MIGQTPDSARSWRMDAAAASEFVRMIDRVDELEGELRQWRAGAMNQSGVNVAYGRGDDMVNIPVWAQDLYDATTHLQAVLTFTHTAEDLLSPEFDYACRRLILARQRARDAGFTHTDAALLSRPELPL